MQTVTLGPFMLSVGVVALVLGVIAAQTTADFLRRRGQASVDAPLWWLAGGAVLVARIAHVVRFPAGYLRHWPDIVDVRGGGFEWWAGLAFLAAAVSVIAWRRRPWRVALPLVAAVGVGVWGVTLVAALQLERAAQQPLPQLVLQDLDGAPVDLADLRGAPMVVNLWATWCGPCRREMPVLVDGEREHPEVRFVFADQGEGAGEVRRFLAEQQLAPERVLLDAHAELARHYNVPGYPTTLFLDAEGRLRDRHVGELTRAMLHNRLQRLIASPLPDGDGS